MAAAMGEGTFRHICFGVAALRMTDGSHLLFSNLFALLPANMTATIHADREAGQLWMQADFHRHVISVTLRHPERAALLVRGIDIFLTRPTSMLDMRKAVAHTTDDEGRTTSLTFGELTQQPLLQHLDQLAFYPSMTIGIGQSGHPLLVQKADYGGIPAGLSDMRRWSGGAQVAFSHSGAARQPSCTIRSRSASATASATGSLQVTVPTPPAPPRDRPPTLSSMPSPTVRPSATCGGKVK